MNGFRYFVTDAKETPAPRTPLVWAYEVKAQRDELLAAANALLHALYSNANPADPIDVLIRIDEAGKRFMKVVNKMENKNENRP